jgi:iron complex outermembrane receptor protein
VTIPDVAPVLTDTFIVVGEGRISKALAPDFVAGNGSAEQHSLAITAQGTSGVCGVSPANGTGKVIYTPNDSSFVGNDTCQLTLADADDDTVSAPIRITVTPKAKTGGAGSFDALSFLLLGFAPLLRRRAKRAERTRSLRATASTVAALAFLAGGVTASGQDVEDSPGETVETPAAPDPTAPEPAAEEKSTGKSAAAIDEIVVTSRKLEEKLLEVPLAITAFDSNAIEALGIRNLADVASLTPGLSFFNPTGESLPVPIIRGVVPTDIFGENNAAIFVDGVYISGREGLNFSQLDVERIEVVKGPQSALYGRNAFSGAINYVTRKPSEEFEAKTNFTLGNRDQVIASGTLSGPILGENLRGRIAALYDDWDGSYNNSFPGGNDIGGHRYRSIQSSVLWLPAEAWAVDLNYYHSNDEIDDAAIVSLPANCQDQVGDNNATVRYQNFCGSIPSLEDIPGQNFYESIAKVPGATGENRDLDRGSLKVEWDLYEHGTISSLTGYSHTEQDSVIDFTRNLGENQVFLYCANALPGTPGVPNSCAANPANQRFTTGLLDDEPGATTDEISQELRYTSSQDQRWRYSAGGYWFSTNRTSSAANNRGYTIATQPVPGGEPLGVGTIGLPPFDPAAPDFAIGTAIFYTTFTADGGRDPLDRDKLDNDDESWALFSGTDFDINDQLTARAELRLSQNKVTVRDIAYAACADKTDPACGDDVFDLRVTGQQPYLNADGECIIDGQPAATVACSKKGSERFESVTGRIGLDWQFTDEWMVYGSIAYGEKPGGVQLATARVIAEDGSLETRLITNSFEQEELTAYELGLKGTTWDGRLVISTSVFYNDWQKIVLPQLLLNDPASGLPLEQPLRVSINEADAGVLGFEIETSVGFTENFTGRFTLGWTDAELKNALQESYALFPDYAAEGFATDGGDVSGNTLLRQPEWLLSGSLAYQHQLAGEWDWYASGDANYQSGIYVGNDNQSWIPSHTYVNTKLGVENAVYSIEFWTRNLFDQGKAVAAYRDIYFGNTDNQYAPAVDQGPRPNFDDFVPWRYTVSYPSERTYGITFRMRFGAAVR